MGSRKPRDKERSPAANAADPPIRVGGWDAGGNVRWRSFPGPRSTGEAVRVSFSRDAYAELVSHAKSSLEAEVCGVLVGSMCEDDEGRWVDVEAIVRGHAAREAGAHVTFTQETWTRIHAQRERDYPKLDIVGWYHTHPGFGVEFSEMDLFIQKNFFSTDCQVAFLTDPLRGDDAVCVSLPHGIEHLPRVYVDGRERPCRVPQRRAPAAGGTAPGAGGDLAAAIRSLEERVAQLIRAADDQRNALYRFLLMGGLLLGCALIVVVGWNLYVAYTRSALPPEGVKFATVPVPIGDDLYQLGVNVVRWKVPEEAEQALYEEFKRRVLGEALELQKKLDQEQKARPAPGRATDTRPAGSDR